MPRFDTIGEFAQRRMHYMLWIFRQQRRLTRHQDHGWLSTCTHVIVDGLLTLLATDQQLQQAQRLEAGPLGKGRKATPRTSGAAAATAIIDYGLLLLPAVLAEIQRFYGISGRIVH